MSDVLDERQKTHGDYADVAHIADAIRHVMESSKNWCGMPPVQRDAITMIASKLGRIGSGNNNCKDHWVDVGGYAELIARDL